MVDLGLGLGNGRVSVKVRVRVYAGCSRMLTVVQYCFYSVRV